MSEKLRLDKYLWSIRVFKTRTQATAAIDEGKVKLGGMAVKAARPVAVGDRYDIKTPARRWVIEVTGLLHNRVGYEDALKHYVDLTTEEDKKPVRVGAAFYTGKRMSHSGKPSKKDRRELGDLLEGE